MKTCLFLFLFSFCLAAQVSAQTPYVLFRFDSCNFETVCNRVILGTDSPQVWQIGAVQKPGFDSAYSPPNALVTDTLTPYPVSVTSCFEVDLEELPEMTTYVLLSFLHRYETDRLLDGGYIEVSVNGAQDWENVLLDPSFSLHTEQLYDTSDTLHNGEYGFSGSSEGWITSQLEWSVQSVARAAWFGLQVRFCFTSDSLQTNKAGWMIDNILLQVMTEKGNHVTDQHIATALVAYPNPAADRLNLQFSPNDAKAYSFTIFNVLGQKMPVKLPLKVGTSQVDITDFPAGVYSIQVQEGQKVAGYKRFVKQ